MARGKGGACEASVRQFVNAVDSLLQQNITMAKISNRLTNEARDVGSAYIRYEADGEIREAKQVNDWMRVSLNDVEEWHGLVLRNCQPGDVMSFRKKTFRRLTDED